MKTPNEYADLLTRWYDYHVHKLISTYCDLPEPQLQPWHRLIQLFQVFWVNTSPDSVSDILANSFKMRPRISIRACVLRSVGRSVGP